MVGVVLVAIVAGVAPSVTAQPAPRDGREASAGLRPEVFTPGAVNRSPQGGPIPDGGQLLGGTQAPEGGRQELVERRTEDSRTFDVGDGVKETVFYDGAANYRDAAGRWQPIDPSLVPVGRGGALRTKAGPVSVELPAVVGAAPVRVSSGDASVAFTLRGARAGPQPGVPAAGAALDVPEEVQRFSATYTNALPGVSVTYAAMAEGVKEELVLADAKAQSSFDFTVSLREGLSAIETAEGGVSIVDGTGVEKAAITRPSSTTRLRRHRRRVRLQRRGGFASHRRGRPRALLGLAPRGNAKDRIRPARRGSLLTRATLGARRPWTRRARGAAVGGRDALEVRDPADFCQSQPIR